MFHLCFCSPLIFLSTFRRPDDHNVEPLRRALQHYAPGGHPLGGHRQGRRSPKDNRPHPHGPDSDRKRLSHHQFLSAGRAADGHAARVGHAETAPVLHRLAQQRAEDRHDEHGNTVLARERTARLRQVGVVFVTVRMLLMPIRFKLQDEKYLSPIL